MTRIACLNARYRDLTDALGAAELALTDARQVHSHRVADDLQLLDATLGGTPADPSNLERLTRVRERIASLVATAF
jgi:hypothetical protein